MAAEQNQYPLDEWQDKLGDPTGYCLGVAARILVERDIVTDGSTDHCYQGNISGGGGCHAEVGIYDGGVAITAPTPREINQPKRNPACKREFWSDEGNLKRDETYIANKLASLGFDSTLRTAEESAASPEQNA